eukprot:ctg_2551.g349
MQLLRWWSDVGHALLLGADHREPGCIGRAGVVCRTHDPPPSDAIARESAASRDRSTTRAGTRGSSGVWRGAGGGIRRQGVWNNEAKELLRMTVCHREESATVAVKRGVGATPGSVWKRRRPRRSRGVPRDWQSAPRGTTDHRSLSHPQRRSCRRPPRCDPNSGGRTPRHLSATRQQGHGPTVGCAPVGIGGALLRVRVGRPDRAEQGHILHVPLCVSAAAGGGPAAGIGVAVLRARSAAAVDGAAVVVVHRATGATAHRLVSDDAGERHGRTARHLAGDVQYAATHERRHRDGVGVCAAGRRAVAGHRRLRVVHDAGRGGGRNRRRLLRPVRLRDDPVGQPDHLALHRVGEAGETVH